MVEVFLILNFGDIELLFIGLVIYIGDVGYVGMILLCFGLGYKYGIVLGNLVGLIDLDYQGQFMVFCWNWGSSVFIIEFGECIVQLVIVLVMQVVLIQVDEFDDSVCGEGGFGYSGCQ